MSRVERHSSPAASTEVAVEAIEAERGTTRTVRVTGVESCNDCDGAGVPAGAPVEVCSACEGGGRITRSTDVGSRGVVQVDACPSCGGTGRVAPERCARCRGTGQTAVVRKVTVPIPAGVRGGERLRVDGVDVLVRVLPERDFRLVRYASIVALTLALALFLFLLVSLL
jgi:DnaJ-class molecular chaperone